MRGQIHYSRSDWRLGSYRLSNLRLKFLQFGQVELWRFVRFSRLFQLGFSRRSDISFQMVKFGWSFQTGLIGSRIMLVFTNQQDWSSDLKEISSDGWDKAKAIFFHHITMFQFSHLKITTYDVAVSQLMNDVGYCLYFKAKKSTLRFSHNRMFLAETPKQKIIFFSFLFLIFNNKIKRHSANPSDGLRASLNKIKSPH